MQIELTKEKVEDIIFTLEQADVHYVGTGNHKNLINRIENQVAKQGEGNYFYCKCPPDLKSGVDGFHHITSRDCVTTKKDIAERRKERKNALKERKNALRENAKTN